MLSDSRDGTENSKARSTESPSVYLQNTKLIAPILFVPPPPHITYYPGEVVRLDKNETEKMAVL